MWRGNMREKIQVGAWGRRTRETIFANICGLPRPQCIFLTLGPGFLQFILHAIAIALLFKLFCNERHLA